MCIESHFIIFSMDDFWLALIVTNQSQQSLALDVDVLEFASQIEILRKLIHFILPSLSLSHWLFLCAFGLAFLFFLLICASSFALSLGWGSSYFFSVLDISSSSFPSFTKHIFYEWTRLVATFFVCFARANHHFENNLFFFFWKISHVFLFITFQFMMMIAQKAHTFSDPWNCL